MSILASDDNYYTQKYKVVISETSNCISMRMSNNNRIKCSYPDRNSSSHERNLHGNAETYIVIGTNTAQHDILEVDIENSEQQDA